MIIPRLGLAWRSAASAAAAVFSLATPSLLQARPVDFHREIRPLLSENCYACHGPDDKARKAKLRLDQREVALHPLPSGDRVIVPGQPNQSQLIARITAKDPEDIMPPPRTGKTLSAAQKQLFRRWIAEGASWPQHWSFVKPERPALPPVKNRGWVRNPIDDFVLARLEKSGLPPSPEADKPTLVRRVTLDLTGLPPTLEEIDRFLADRSPQAYDRLVDRLLASPRYGEQMAHDWLDAARYADTHGFHIDSYRSIWEYRNWVIDAYNHNLPFDQFTIDQLAGDLLPHPTLAQRVATGFNRCNMTTGEGGAIPEEYLAKYAIDRAMTTGTVWLGLTVGCAQCHNHKYDPITQKDFYEFYAFFNNIAEEGLDGNKPNPDPYLRVPDAAQAARLAQFDQDIAAAEQRLEAPLPSVDAAQARWEQRWTERLSRHWTTLAAVAVSSAEGATLQKLPDNSILASGKNPEYDVFEFVARVDGPAVGALRLDALTDPSLPHHGASRADNGNFVLSEFEAAVAPVDAPDQWRTIHFAAAYADYSQDGFEVGKAIDGKMRTGWAVDGDKHRENRLALFVPTAPVSLPGPARLRVRLHFASPHAQHTIGRFRLALEPEAEIGRLLAPAHREAWSVVGPFTAASGAEAFKTPFPPEQAIDLHQTFLDGKLQWREKPEFTDGKVHDLSGENAATYLYRLVHAPSARTVTLSLGSDDALKLWVNGKLVLAREVQRAAAPDQDQVRVDLVAGENRILAKVVNYSGGYAFYYQQTGEEVDGMPLALAPIFAVAPPERTTAQQRELRDIFRRDHSPEWQALAKALDRLKDDRAKFEASVPTTLVMKEIMDKPREAHILIRGQYDQPGERVLPDVPAFLPPLPAGMRHDRLALAHWLLDPANPLTARVVVNRYWQHYFGNGIVETTGDFGTQGAWPSHPLLLDWLATEFIRNGWNVKAMQRLIVTSATYRQSSETPAWLRERDPQNHWLARGPRFRVDAEMVRDSALAEAGLLVEKLGGPSVKPYEPPGLWEAVSYANRQKYVQDEGEGNYRRSLYTFWKRQSPPPGMLVMDCPSRETCIVRRDRANTPLQALFLLDDPQFVEASRALAQRMMLEGGYDPVERATYGFRLVTGRLPRPAETQILLDVLTKEVADFRAHHPAAEELLSVGAFKARPSLNPAELAAWTTIASMLLNLDEAITKS